jgi:hypothetical protein
MTTEDKIIQALHAINTTMAQSATAPSDMQLNAINTLRTILQDYQRHTTGDDAPPGVHPSKGPTATPTNRPTAVPRHPATASAVRPRATPPGVPAPAGHPASGRGLDNQWTTVLARPRRPTPTPAPRATDLEPVAAHTQSHGKENYYALLAKQEHTEDDNRNENSPIAAPVLDTATGTMLEHWQLRRHPTYKKVWDESYANELGRLCQGIGTNPANPTKKRVDGTDTFKPIHYHNIPQD